MNGHKRTQEHIDCDRSMFYFVLFIYRVEMHLDEYWFVYN